MAKHDEPLSYESRVRDTKGVVQRLDLNYLRHPSRFRDLRRTLMWIAPLAALAASLPFVIGVGGTERVFSNGPVSRAHAIFENNCRACHVTAFSSVVDRACLGCHDGPGHPAKNVDTAKLLSAPSCTACHLEHRGADLAEVSDRNCTGCHKALVSQAAGVQIKNVAITAFRQGKHPDFPAPGLSDTRPLRLNHAAHVPDKAKTISGMNLPMKCGDCHATSLSSAAGDLEPVTFDRHCQSCHKRELEFVLPGIPSEAPPAPHTKDAPAIRQFIADTYQKLVVANPSLVTLPLDRDMAPEANAEAWIARAARMSEKYLFENKCKYCHEYDPARGEFPTIKKVQPIRGRYVEGKPEGEPWLPRGEFSHRAHRAVDCASCHTAARASTKSTDVLIAGMNSCIACHESGNARIGRCSQCHMYHNKSKERDRDRKSIEQLVGRAGGG